MTALLEISRLNSWYGSSQALFNVDLTVDNGEVVALMGRNGMGKSTLIKSICQLLGRWEGEMRFEGIDLSGMPSHEAARLGLGLVPEGRRCFPNLTVYENCIASACPGPWQFKTVCDLFPRLHERHNQSANTLSGGEQQMLALARALCTNPKLLLLDEATEGLAPNIRLEIWQALGKLKETGLSILLVDKSLSEISTIADRAVILKRGEVAWTGDLSGLSREQQSQMLGL